MFWLYIQIIHLKSILLTKTFVSNYVVLREKVTYKYLLLRVETYISTFDKVWCAPCLYSLQNSNKLKIVYNVSTKVSEHLCGLLWYLWNKCLLHLNCSLRTSAEIILKLKSKYINFVSLQNSSLSSKLLKGIMGAPFVFTFRV